VTSYDHVMRSATLLVLVTACGRSAEPTPAPPAPPPCEATITDAARRIGTASQRVGLDQTIERTRLTMIASCETESWPADVIGCIGSARLEVDLASCTEKLTHEQYERLNKKLAKLAPKPADPVAVTVPTATPPVPAPPAPTAVAQTPPRPPAPKREPDLMEPGGAAARAKADCAKSIADPRSAACRNEYCRANPHDARCDLLE